MTITVMKKCGVAECTKLLLANGVCGTHNWRFKRYGSYDQPPLSRSRSLHGGEVPAYKDAALKKVVMHSCDNPECTNPNHLSIGTQKENMHDAAQKGRIRSARKGGKRLFDAKTAISIFLASGIYKHIAEEYGCSADVVAGIKSGRSWNNITQQYAS